MTWGAGGVRKMWDLKQGRASRLSGKNLDLKKYSPRREWGWDEKSIENRSLECPSDHEKARGEAGLPHPERVG